MALGRRVKELRTDMVSPLAVNVVFQVPGRFLTPEFEGIRSGTFSRKERRLMVQVALPLDVSATPDADLRTFVRDAVELAENFAQQEAMIVGRLVDLRDLVARL
jgi:hypothetical protein